MPSLLRGGIVVLCAAAALAFAGPAAASNSAVVGHLYVNDNTASGGNSISGFDRHANGTLTPIPGSPFNPGERALERASRLRAPADEQRRSLSARR